MSLVTVAQLLQEIRADLDEPVAARWQDADLVTWVNDGTWEVQVTIRGQRQDWFTKRMKSTDGALTINGQSYNASSLKIASGTDSYVLPPDLVEIRRIVPIDAAILDKGIAFRTEDMTTDAFMRASRHTDPPEEPVVFYYDAYGLNNLLIKPTPQTAFDIEMFYVHYRNNLREEDQIDILPDWALPPLKQFAKYRAYAAIGHEDTNTQFARFQASMLHASSFSMLRQSQNPMIVDGVFENERGWW